MDSASGLPAYHSSRSLLRLDMDKREASSCHKHTDRSPYIFEEISTACNTNDSLPGLFPPSGLIDMNLNYVTKSCRAQLRQSPFHPNLGLSSKRLVLHTVRTFTVPSCRSLPIEYRPDITSCSRRPRRDRVAPPALCFHLGDDGGIDPALLLVVL